MSKRSTAAVTAERIRIIADIMNMGLWRPGPSGEGLAAEWGVSISRVQQLAAEAWRNVCAASDDAAKLRPQLAGGLFVLFEQARAARKYDAAAKLADVLSKITGARAVERHEFAHITAQYDALDNAGRVAYFRNLIKEATEAIAAIEAGPASTTH